MHRQHTIRTLLSGSDWVALLTFSIVTLVGTRSLPLPVLTPHSTFPRSITRSITRGAVSRLGHFAVRSETLVRVDAPEVAGVRRRHSRIMLDADKHALPTQMRTEHGMIHVKALGFSNHFAPRDRAALRSGSLPRCVIVRADLNAEDAEFFAKGAEKYSPSRTSATASASSAFKRVLSLDSCSSFDTDSLPMGEWTKVTQRPRVLLA